MDLWADPCGCVDCPSGFAGWATLGILDTKIADQGETGLNLCRFHRMGEVYTVY